MFDFKKRYILTEKIIYWNDLFDSTEVYFPIKVVFLIRKMIF